MSGFLYFVPRLGGLDLFRSLGIDYAFDGDPKQTEVTSRFGPDGQGGMVFHDHPTTSLPTPIKWHEASAGGYWIGWHSKRPPGPSDLTRGKPLAAGATITLRDGRGWCVPLVLPCKDIDPTRRRGLPVQYDLGATDGESTQDRFAPLVMAAERFLESFESEEPKPIPNRDMLAYCVQLLQVGYRIGTEEVVALDLIDPREQARAMALASIDADERFRATLKPEDRVVYDEHGLPFADLERALIMEGYIG